MTAFRRLLLTMEAWSPRAVLLLSLGLTALVGVADYLTGPLLSSAIFYVAPVAVSAWYGNTRMGTFISGAAAIAWYLADMSGSGPYVHTFIPVWNALVRLGLFLIIVYLFVNFREQLRVHQELAFTDPLTGLPNARAFYARVEEELQRANRYRHGFSLGYIDVDDFKRVNDTFGHTAGDDLLRTIAHAMHSGLRRTDLVARLGGDEFSVLMPETGPQAAHDTLAKLRRRLGTKTADMPIGFSIGMITFLSTPEDVRQMIKLVDDLMYSVKRGHKNDFVHAVWEGGALIPFSPGREHEDRSAATPQ